APPRGGPPPGVGARGHTPPHPPPPPPAGLGAAGGPGAETVRAAADVVVGPCAEGAVADLVARVLP
ncbi:conjugal transfer protein TrbL, partial [Actinomadura sp. NPDC048032]